ncbi:hypothetical protein Ancab_001564, partial [Ancistrocladus abbreviatus]
MIANEILNAIEDLEEDLENPKEDFEEELEPIEGWEEHPPLEPTYGWIKEFEEMVDAKED